MSSGKAGAFIARAKRLLSSRRYEDFNAALQDYMADREDRKQLRVIIDLLLHPDGGDVADCSCAIGNNTESVNVGLSMCADFITFVPKKQKEWYSAEMASERERALLTAAAGNTTGSEEETRDTNTNAHTNANANVNESLGATASASAELDRRVELWLTGGKGQDIGSAHTGISWSHTKKQWPAEFYELFFKNSSTGNDVDRSFSVPESLTGSCRLSLRQLHTSPNIYCIDNFLSEWEVGQLLALCDDRIEDFTRSKVEDERAKPKAEESNNGCFLSAKRTSTYIWLRKGASEISRVIEGRAAHLLGLTSKHVEPLQVVRYVAGQRFDRHHDSGTVYGANGENSNKTDGKNVEGGYQTEVENVRIVVTPPKRVATLFVYLTDIDTERDTSAGERGGHTEFTELNGLSVEPRRGRAVLWSNVLQNAEPDPLTMHRGCPVPEGAVKLGVNVWVCENELDIMDLSKLAEDTSIPDFEGLITKYKKTQKMKQQQLNQKVKSQKKKEEALTTCRTENREVAAQNDESEIDVFELD